MNSATQTQTVFFILTLLAGHHYHCQFGFLVDLSILYLDTNSFNGTIPSELGRLTKLTRTSLHINSLSGSIPTELGNLQRMSSYFRLYSNQLSSTLPTQLGNFVEMRSSFAVFSNKLTGQSAVNYQRTCIISPAPTHTPTSA